MGKSPGKWIKTVLFGKKQPKSNLSKTAANTQNLSENSQLATDLSYQLTDRGSKITQLEKVDSGSQRGATGLNPDYISMTSQSNPVPVPSIDAEVIRQEQSVTKVQATFRGYLARRAYRALKGIIRLQALIRGHLVRRQAVATLRCMQAIVKLQALVRKQKDVVQMENMSNSYLGFERLAKNTFVRKLIVSSSTAVPLSLQYDMAEPNSAWNWLERWSLSHLCEPLACTKNVIIKPQRKLGGTQILELGTGKSKRSTRNVSGAANGDACAIDCIMIDKHKHNPRKITSHQTELLQEHPQCELDRVKNNLRKVSAFVTAASEKSVIDTDEQLPQLQSSVKIIPSTTASESTMVTSSEGPTDPDIVPDKHDLVKILSKTSVVNEQSDMSQDDHPTVELRTLENGGKMESPQIMTENPKEQIVKENKKIRRKSLPVKQEYAETIPENAASLPSYMAATESAKAKLRQGSSKLDDDEADYGYDRRHSLPASTNGKLSSLSPQLPKSLQHNGKGGRKTNRSLTTHRDDKASQPGWRR